MSLKDKLRPNALILAGMAFVLAAGSLAAICVGLGQDWAMEVLLLLAATFGGSSASLVGLSAQVAQDPPPPQIPESSAKMMLEESRNMIGEWKYFVPKES